MLGNKSGELESPQPSVDEELHQQIHALTAKCIHLYGETHAAGMEDVIMHLLTNRIEAAKQEHKLKAQIKILEIVYWAIDDVKMRQDGFDHPQDVIEAIQNKLSKELHQPTNKQESK